LQRFRAKTRHRRADLHGTCRCVGAYDGRFAIRAMSMTALASKSRLAPSSCAAWILHRNCSSPCSSRRTISALHFARDEKTARRQIFGSSPLSSIYGSIICTITSRVILRASRTSRWFDTPIEDFSLVVSLPLENLVMSHPNFPGWTLRRKEAGHIARL
jgi:hypothetical protein